MKLKKRSNMLEKIAIAKLRAEGFEIGDQFTLSDAVRVLGTKLYQKNAEYKRIVEGIEAFDKLRKSERLLEKASQSLNIFGGEPEPPKPSLAAQAGAVGLGALAADRGFRTAGLGSVIGEGASPRYAKFIEMLPGGNYSVAGAGALGLGALGYHVGKKLFYPKNKQQ